MAKIVVNLLPYWHQKERELGRRLTYKEVQEATGVDARSISKLKGGKLTRFDASVLVPLCRFFDVPDGEPIPFLTVSYENNKETNNTA